MCVTKVIPSKSKGKEGRSCGGGANERHFFGIDFCSGTFLKSRWIVEKSLTLPCLHLYVENNTSNIFEAEKNSKTENVLSFLDLH